jgi:hypothetical protein
MADDLYKQFSAAILSLSYVDMPDAVDTVETFIRQAAREHGGGATFPSRLEGDLAVNLLLRAFDGHTVGEAVAVMSRLRTELADELARRGAPAEDVAEVRGGGGSRS